MPALAAVVLGLTLAACGGQSGDGDGSSSGEMSVAAYGGPDVDSSFETGSPSNDETADDSATSGSSSSGTDTGSSSSGGGSTANQSETGSGTGSESSTGGGSSSGSTSTA
ncbi:MAG: hypothetical protein AAGF11_52280 [Myxococcota bacterium]